MNKGFMARLRAMFGIRSEAERKREEEMEYRMKLREVENKTRMMKQETEKRKQQAIQLEKNGEHQKAVAMALKAENGRKAYVRAAHFGVVAGQGLVHNLTLGAGLLQHGMGQARRLRLRGGPS